MAFSVLKRRTDTFDYVVQRSCLNCSHEFNGRYCPKCGEKVFEPSERSIIRFLEGLLNAFTFLDGKFFNSMKLLLTKPGVLSRNIADGRQVPYMKMISLFFVANFFYFLFPTFDSFNSSLYTQMNLLGNHSEQVTRIVNDKLSADGISLNEFMKKYEPASTNISKLLIILLVVASSLVLSVVNYSKKAYYFEHLVFSFEFYSFLIFFGQFILPVAVMGLVQLFGTVDDDFLLVAFVAYFLFTAERNFYLQKWYWAIARTFFLVFMLYVSVTLYRMLLFYITMWWIG